MINQKFIEVPQEARPRERMEDFGPAALANHELLAILLRTGTKEQNVLQLSMQVLSNFDDLYTFKHASLEELMSITGIGKAKAIEMLAMIELGKRMAKTTQLKEGTVTSSQFVGKLLMEELNGLQQEIVLGLFLNTKNEIIKKEVIFKGSLNTSVAYTK